MLMKTKGFPEIARLDDDAGWVDFPPSPESDDLLSALLKQGRPFIDAPAPRRPDPVAAAAPPAPDAQPGKPRRFRGLVAAAALVALAAGGYFGHYWWTVGRFTVSTD